MDGSRSQENCRACLGDAAALVFVFCLFFALSCPLTGQVFSGANASASAQIAAVASEEEDEEPPRLAAAAWCAVRSRKAEAESKDKPACDVGVGLGIVRWGHLSAVGVLGAQTLGLGLAWVPYRGDNGPTIAVAIGAVLRYDAGGVYLNSVAPAIGATLSFAGRRRR